MEVIARTAVAGVFVYLSLSLFFCLLRGSYAAPLGVLQVLLLLGGCSAF